MKRNKVAGFNAFETRECNEVIRKYNVFFGGRGGVGAHQARFLGCSTDLQRPLATYVHNHVVQPQ